MASELCTTLDVSAALLSKISSSPTVKVRRTLGSKAIGKHFARITDEAMHCNGGRRASLVRELGTKFDVLADPAFQSDPNQDC